MLRRLAHVAHIFAEAEDVDQVLRALKVVSDPTEIGAVSVGRRQGEKTFSRAAGLEDQFLQDWRGEYLRRGLSLPARYAELSPPPFTMAEVKRRLQPSGADHWLSDLCNDYGIRDSLWCAYGPWMVIYHSTRRLTRSALPEDIRAGLGAAGAMAVWRLKGLTQFAEGRPRLSPRERTILLHLSQGLTAPQIAMQLEVGEATVRTFITRACRKLGANSQLHAVAIALRERLI